MHTAEDLLRKAFGASVEENRALLLIGDLPESRYKRFPLQNLPLNNPDGKSVKNCGFWFQDGHYNALLSRLKINVYEDVSDCDFYFIRTPLKGSKLTFDLKGNGHKAVILSKQRVTIFCRLIRRNSTFALGEGIHVGGCKIALDDTTFRIGAGGLWSDGILVQGTDSHGIIDLDSMKIVNDAPKHITFGRRVWIGRDAKIMKNLTIGDGSIVGTGAMVTKDVPPACIAAGFPAKIVKTRMSWSGRQNSMTPFEQREMAKLKEKMHELPAPVARASSTGPATGSAAGASTAALTTGPTAGLATTGLAAGLTAAPAPERPARGYGLAKYVIAGAIGAGTIEAARLLLFAV